MSSEQPPVLPTVLVIFGATGDLIQKKIVPALFHLFEKHALPPLLRVIGFSRQNLSDDQFRQRVKAILKTHDDEGPVSDYVLDAFLKLFYYQQGQFDQEEDYKKVAATLGQVDGQWRVCSNKLFYLAVPPQWYETISGHLASSGLTTPCGVDEGWTRVLVEKPFGHDLATAETLEELLGSLFREIQIYRIDHYLAKEMMQNILSFRFSNNLFAANWNHTVIERIDIRFLETVGVEDRGRFYDGLGALRDVGQNHLLQMLAFITMEHPGDFRASAIRLQRAKLLAQLHVLTADEIKTETQRAQYDGYRSITGVKADSSTETYFKITAAIDSERWHGVPITLESGKRLPEARKEIVVTFRHPHPCLCPEGTAEHFKNIVTFRIEPTEEITITATFKKPGLAFELEQRELEISLRDTKGAAQYVEEYEKLLYDCISGDQTLFVSTAEVKAMWRFIDPIIREWQHNNVTLGDYVPGQPPG